MRRAWMPLAAAILTVTGLHGAGLPADMGELPVLLARLGESVTRYYARAQSILCIETVRLHSLGRDLVSDSSPSRRLDYELRVAWDGAAEGRSPEARIFRQLIKVNGRAPRAKDEPGCMDPRAVSPEPLSIFLPERQSELSFAIAGAAKVRGRRAVMLDFRFKVLGPAKMSATKECLTFELPGRERGRAWIDPESGEVLRLDTHLIGMFDFTLPSDHRQTAGPLALTIERFDSSIVYKPVAFSEPEETLMLPASISTLSVIRNSSAPRLRIVQDFSRYQRFITGGRVVSTDVR